MPFRLSFNLKSRSSLPNYYLRVLTPGIFFFILGMALMLIFIYSPIRIAGYSIQMHPMVVSSLLAMLGFQIILYSIIAKDYGVTSGLIEKSKTVALLRKYFTLERGIMIGAMIASIGFLIDLGIFYNWMTKNALSSTTLKLSILATTLLVIGIEIIFTSFLMSIFSIKRIYER